MNAGHRLAGKLFFSMVYILIYPALFLFLAGNWGWTEGLIFCGWFLALCYGAIFYLYHRNPELFVERFKMPGTGNQANWDRYVVYLLMLGFTSWFILMPLDAERFKWSRPFPDGLKVAGMLSLLLSSFFFYRSYTDNPYLSPLVRIQTDRRQRVVSTGVYSYVRHPMYLGAILLFLGAPSLLNSSYGLLIGLAMALLLVFRIIGEEKLLVNELEGYADYKYKVKYRLIPYIW